MILCVCVMCQAAEDTTAITRNSSAELSAAFPLTIACIQRTFTAECQSNSKQLHWPPGDVLLN